MQWDATSLVGNGVSLAAIVGTIVGWLPPLAALAAIIWYVIQIHESKTIQKWIAAYRARKVAKLHREINRLKSKLKQEE